jgi:hypothetical protein
LLAICLAVGGIVVAVSEGFANHQALAWAAVALLFAIAIFLDASSRVPVSYRRTIDSAPSSSPPAAGSGT